MLRNAGVCESYALAYRILLHELGIESLYVTGSSRNAAHAWSLVKIDGQWAHVDVTWDDPVGGGDEGHDYFGMNDELLRRDHDWNDSHLVPPAVSTLAYYYLLSNGALPIFDETRLGQLLSPRLREKRKAVEYTFLGIDMDYDVNLAVRQWMDLNSFRYFVDGYQQSGSGFSGRMEITYQNLDNYSAFANKAEFSAIMDTLLKEKRLVIRMFYSGEDETFDLMRFVSDWFAANHSVYGLSGYQLSYLSLAGEITLAYDE